jgi:hypothetical protein
VLDVVLVCAGACAFISGLLPWYGTTASVFGFSGSMTVNAWDAGTSAWLTVLLLSAAGVVALIRLVSGPRPWTGVLPAVLCGLAALCLIARWASWSGDDDGIAGAKLSGSMLSGLIEASAGPEIGFYLAIVALVVALVASGLGARAALVSARSAG